MFKNYFKIAYRNLWRNKTITFINIFGLSIALATAVVVFLLLQNHWTMDNFHQHADRIYIAEYVVENDGEEQVWGNPPLPLGKALANDFPQIEQTVRLDIKGSSVYLADKVFQQSVFFADPAYFELFTFPLETGTPAVLNEPDAIIISAKLAEKYFKDEESLGKALTIVFDNQVKKIFTVKGVAAPFPENTSFAFDIITGFDNSASIGKIEQNDWATHIGGTFIQLKEGATIEPVAANMNKYVALQNASNEDIPIKSFVFDNVKNPNANAHAVNGRPIFVTHPIVGFLFILLALLMLALSSFNYINIALGFAGKKLKEIGIRKTIGGQRIQLVWQFMSENLLLCFLALILSLVIAQIFLIPLLNTIMAMQISLTIIENPSIWLFLVGLLGFTAIASGAYPAFYISAFQPASIFRGSQQIIKKNKLTRLFLGFQFVLSFSAVIIVILILTAGRHWENMGWGYQPDETLMIRLENAKQYDIFKSEMERNPYVQKVGGSMNHVGESSSVGADYFDAMGLQLREGRFFDAFRPAADAQTVVINQLFADQQAWDNPLGQTFRKRGQIYTVVGVVENFKIEGIPKKEPVSFYLAPPETYGYMAIRHAAGTNQEVKEYAQKHWATLYPDSPFNYFHQHLIFEIFYQRFGNASRFYSCIAGLALLIACMGLFGLATQNYARYLKEVSIRKVLGASVSQVVFLVNRKFLVMLLIASLTATLISWMAMTAILAQTKEYIGELNLGITPFILGNLLVFTMAIIAIGSQTYKLSKITPADALRIE